MSSNNIHKQNKHELLLQNGNVHSGCGSASGVFKKKQRICGQYQGFTPGLEVAYMGSKQTESSISDFGDIIVNTSKNILSSDKNNINNSSDKTSSYDNNNNDNDSGNSSGTDIILEGCDNRDSAVIHVKGGIMKDNDNFESPDATELVNQLHMSLKEGKYAASVGIDASVYLTAVLRCISSKVLHDAYQVSKTSNDERIVPVHIQRAINDDAELNKFVNDVIISNGAATDAWNYNLALMEYLQQIRQTP